MKTIFTILKRINEPLNRLIYRLDSRISRITSPFLNATRRYRTRVMDAFFRTLAAAIFTYLFFILCFYMGKMLWHLYLSTPTGEQFLSEFSVEARFFKAFFTQDSIGLANFIVFTCLQNCFVVAIISRFFHLQRALYESRGVVGKIVLWAGALTYISACQIRDTFTFEPMGVVFTIAFIPTVFLYGYCFQLGKELVPELGEVLRNKTLRNSFNRIRTFTKSTIQKLLESLN